MKGIKTYILGFLISCSTMTFGQNPDSIFNHSVGQFNFEHIEILKKSGLISDFQMSMFGTYLVEQVGLGNNIDTSLTYKQLFDSLNIFIEKMNSKIFIDNHFGNDSVFLRVPSGEKVFVGMGEMSLEKLTQRESENLPEEYQTELLNQNYSDPLQIVEIIEKQNLNEFQSGIFGSVLIILFENDLNYSNYRLGDFLEISKRIINSKEFKPFLKFEKEE